MDAFECRLTFTKFLSKLSASNAAAKQASSFALKNRELSEDLHSCILEQIGQQSMNVRVNLLFFIETLCEASKKEGYSGYIDMIKRDMMHIIDNVAPDEEGGVVNVEAARQVIRNLKDMEVIDGETMEMLDDMLVTRKKEVEEADKKKEEAGGELKRAFDDKMIEQRMNEDRQRHKRRRENAWNIIWKDENGNYPEFDHLWETTSDLNSDDIEWMREERELVEQCQQ